jgi:hypothetical protein
MCAVPLLNFLYLASLFPSGDLTENTQIYYEIYSVLLPVRKVATAVNIEVEPLDVD